MKLGDSDYWKSMEEMGGTFSGLGAAAMDEKTREMCRKAEDMVAEHHRKFAAKVHGVNYGDGHGVIDALPEAQRRLLPYYEKVLGAVPAEERHKRPFPKDVGYKVAAGCWLRLHLMKLTNPGEFMQHREEYDRLREALGGVQKIALQEDVAAEGGNLIPTIVQQEILRLVADHGAVRAVARVVPMTAKTHAWPTRAAAVSAAIVAEEGAIGDSVPANPFTQSLLTAKKMACFGTVSGELLQDNVVALTDWLAAEFAEQIARLEDSQALEGDGTGVNFTGLAAIGGINSVAAENPVGTTTNGGPPRYVQFPKVAGAAAEASSLAGAVFFMSPKIWWNILAARADAITAADKAGLPLIAQAVGGGLGVPARQLFGFPVVTSTAILTNRTKGTLTTASNVYFGPGEQIVLGDLLQNTLELNPYSKFSTFQVDVRMVHRVGILIGVPAAFTKYTDVDSTATML